MNDHINECVLECILVYVRVGAGLEYCLRGDEESNESLLHQSITDAPMVSLIISSFNQTKQLKRTCYDDIRNYHEKMQISSNHLS